MTRRTATALCALLITTLGACKKNKGAGECPPGTPEMGTAGAFASESETFTWEWSDRLGLSVGPVQYRIIPDDLVSFSATVDAGEYETAFITFDDAVQRWVDDDWWDNPLYHGPNLAGTMVFPMSSDSFPVAGCVAMQPAAYDDLSGEQGTMHYVSRRFEQPSAGLDLNLIVVGDTALFQDELDAALDVMDRLYVAGGAPGLARTEVYTLDWPGSTIFDADDVVATGELRAAAADTEAQALNIFFITDFIDGGTLGIASGIPGANGVPGTYSSGVIVSVDAHLDGSGEAVDTDLMGETMAHEIGHQLGLFHTTEAEGTAFDIIADTPECDASNDLDGDGYVYAEECEGADGANFMFWTGGSFRQNRMSAGQSDIITFSPIVR